MALRVVTPPADGEMFISLEEAKAHLRITEADDDDLIAGLILAAQDQIEDNTQRRYLTQSLEWVVNGYWGSGDDGLTLPVAPSGGSNNISIDQIQYVAMDGAIQVLDPSLYWARPKGATLTIVKRWFVMWPWLGDGAERVIISFSVAGAPSTVPNRVKQAMKLLVSHWYENRDAVVGVDNRDSSTELPLGVEALLTAERWS